MSNTILFANNASTALASAISNSAVTATLVPGGGALFPSPGANEVFRATFTQAANKLIKEIVTVTNVTGDVVTIVRGQEGTTPLPWSAGDFFENLYTAGTADQFVQQVQAQSGMYNYAAVDSGTANSYAITLAPVPLSILQEGMSIVFKAANANTGTSTLTVNGTTRPLSTPLRNPLLANYILAGSLCTVMYESQSNTFILQSSTGGQTEYAHLDSPIFTGNPRAPTPTVGNSTTSIATTAFVNQTSSLVQNGWKIYPDGMVEQWGVANFSGTVDTTITLPISFPNHFRNVTATPVYELGTGTVYYAATNTFGGSLSSFIGRITPGALEGTYWRALGD